MNRPFHFHKILANQSTRWHKAMLYEKLTGAQRFLTMKYSTDMDQFNRVYGGEEFKELTNPGHEVKHDLAYSVDSSWYGFVYRHSNGNSLWKLSGL